MATRIEASWWNDQREKAAQMVADGSHSREEIFTELGISRRTLQIWMSREDFQDRVQEIYRQYRVAVGSKGLREKSNRVQALLDRVDKLNLIIKERGEATGFEGVPGWKSGLLHVRASGPHILHMLDEKLLRELREHEKQIAIELGEWTEQKSIEMNGNLQVSVQDLIAKVYGDPKDSTNQDG